MNGSTDSVKEYVATSRAATGRARTALTGYAIFLLLTSVTITNVYLLNWNDRQLQEAILASKLLRVALPADLPPLGWRAGPEGNSARKLAQAWVDSVQAKTTKYLGSRPVLERVAELAIRSRWDSSSVAPEIEYYQKFRQDHILSVPVPLTQLRIHINSFGLLFTLGLTILLWILYTCLRHERTCLRELKARAAAAVYAGVELDSTIRIMRSTQGRLVTVLALSAPLAFAAWQLWLDWKSRSFGALIDERNTMIVLIGETVGVMLAVANAILVAREAASGDRQ